MHRARAGAGRLGVRAGGRAPATGRRRPRRRRPGAWNQRTARPKRWRLVDGLRRADVVELGRPVGRAHEQRHAGQVGLDDRRVQLDGGGAAGGEHDDGLARGGRQAEGQEAAAALVVVDVDARCGRRRPGRGPAASTASPGQTTACSTPSRAHSSTRVAQKVAWRSSGRGAMAPPSDHTPSARIHAMFLHAERRGAGPPARARPRVHPDRPLLGPRGRRPRRRPRGRAGRRARPRAVGGRSRPGLRAGGRLIADQGGEATYLGYSMGARFCLHVALAQPGARARARAARRHRRHRGPRASAAARRQQDLATAARIERDGSEAFLDDWLAQPLFAGLPPERAVPRRAAARTPSTGCGRASSRPAPARRTRRGTSSTASTCRSSCSPAPTTPSSPRSPSAWPTEIGDNATVALVDGAGHAAHLEQPDRFLRDRPTLARRPRPLTPSVGTVGRRDASAAAD